MDKKFDMKSFFHGVQNGTKNYFEKVKTTWPLWKKINAIMWLLVTALFITVIVLFVAFNGTITEVIAGTENLTEQAVLQQNVVSGVALSFAVFLGITIFTMVTFIYLDKKKGVNNAKSS